jgi:hypothetical protein
MAASYVPLMGKTRKGAPRWIDRSILIGAGFFIFALVLSAVFDPKIRVLHTLQALIYIVVIVLTRRRSAWGYGAGFVIAALWNYINLFVTTFIRNGLEQLLLSLRTAQLHRPDLILALIAAGGHFLMIVACFAGFLRTRPGLRQIAQFAGGGILAVAFFVAIIYTTGPQYIGVLKKAIGL